MTNINAILIILVAIVLFIPVTVKLMLELRGLYD